MNTSESNLQILNQFEVYMLQKRTVSTINSYKSMLSGISHLDWKTCTSTQLMQWRNNYVSTHSTFGSIQRIILMKNFFKILCKSDVNIRQDNPATLLETPSVEKGHKDDCILIDNETYKEIYADCGVPLLDKISFALSQTMGFRISEIVALTIDSIDFDNKIIKVKASKGNKSRIVPMSNLSEKFIQQYMTTFNITDGILLRNKFNKPMTTQALRKRYIKIRDRYGIDKSVNFHKGRHKFLSTLANDPRVALSVVASVAGHSSLSSTKKYIHVDLKEQQKQVLSVINGLY